MNSEETCINIVTTPNRRMQAKRVMELKVPDREVRSSGADTIARRRKPTALQRD